MNNNEYNATSLYFSEDISLFDIDKYTKLSKITLESILIDTNLINKLKTINTLRELVIINSSIIDMESFSKLNIKILVMSNTEMNDYRFINNLTNLEELTILGFDYIDLEVLSITKILKKFIVDRVELLNTDNLFYLNNCNVIGISNAGEVNIDMLLSLENLKVLYLDEDTIKNNINVVGRLKQKGISIKVVGGNYEIL